MTPAALATDTRGPLKGLRVVDMTAVVFGAYATQMLGDLGADVIKVESPPDETGRGGDVMRWAGRPPEGAPPDLGPIFMTINRNKRSVLLDLREARALAALKSVIATADAFVATVRADGLARLGLDYESVKALKPDIVYVHGSGFGAEGPYAGLPAYDDLIQAVSGAADILPIADGDPTPRYLPTVMADKVSGLFMGQAILAALFHRQRTGEGQFVEVPMFECVTSFNLAEHLFGHTFDPPTGPYGYHRVATMNRKPFPTADGHIAMLPYSDKQWRQFFALAGWGETVAKDPRFSAPAARAHHIAELYALMDEATAKRTTEEWLALLRPLNIPAAALNRFGDLLDDPHLNAVGFFERHAHPQAGDYVAMRSPFRFSATPADIRRHPPTLGADTAEVLAELGIELGP